MKLTRRSLFAAAGLALTAALTVAPVQASVTTFTVSGYNKLLKSGQPFIIGVHTEWCSTCAAQKRIISQLRKKSPYNKLRLVQMDWDKYRGSKIGKSLRIPRRSTLIMYNANGKEVGRIIAGTSRSQIKKLIDKGV